MLKKTLILFLFGASAGVSAQTCKDSLQATTPDDRFVLLDGGATVADLQTGLQWKRCSEGQRFRNGGCEGAASTFSWDKALQRPAQVNAENIGDNLGYHNWRLPNIKELSSIVERKCYEPAINAVIFPNTASDWYWSSSANADNSNYAWYVDFDNGNVSYNSKFNSKHVRLVRARQ